MPWVKVDTRFPTHEKVLDIGPLAEALWLRGLCYAGDHLSDGVVPAGFVRRMGDLDGLAEAAKLVAAGLWDEAEGGWRIHDYLDWQRSRDDAEELSAKRAEAGRKGGKQKAINQAETKQTSGKLLDGSLAKAKQTSSKPLADKRREEKKREEGDTPPTPPPAAPASPKVQPFDLFLAVCEEMGQDPAEVTGRARDVQLAAAKHLVASGIGTEDARRLYRWLAPQEWVVRGGGVDLKLMAGQAGKWTMNGRHDAPPTKPAPGSSTLLQPGFTRGASVAAGAVQEEQGS